MAQRPSLREFQQNFAERLRERATQAKVDSKLGFEVGGARYLVVLSDVSEVVPVPHTVAVPKTQPWFVGVANVRGKLFSLVDFSAFQGGALTTASADRRVLLVHEKIIEGSGLVVGKMLGLRNADSLKSARPADPETPWIKHHYTDEHAIPWTELDLVALARNPAFLQVGVVQPVRRGVL